jgi:hypothetical protein
MVNKWSETLYDLLSKWLNCPQVRRGWWIRLLTIYWGTRVGFLSHALVNAAICCMNLETSHIAHGSLHLFIVHSFASPVYLDWTEFFKAFRERLFYFLICAVRERNCEWGMLNTYRSRMKKYNFNNTNTTPDIVKIYRFRDFDALTFFSLHEYNKIYLE